MQRMVCKWGKLKTLSPLSPRLSIYPQNFSKLMRLWSAIFLSILSFPSVRFHALCFQPLASSHHLLPSHNYISPSFTLLLPHHFFYNLFSLSFTFILFSLYASVASFLIFIINISHLPVRIRIQEEPSLHSNLCDIHDTCDRTRLYHLSWDAWREIRKRENIK